MKLRVRYDDGFVAYLWSTSANRPVEIARVNAPGAGPTTPIDALAYNANATANHADGEAMQLIGFRCQRLAAVPAHGSERADRAGH